MVWRKCSTVRLVYFAPIVFGEPIDGPMPSHEPGTPWHYDFHVWLWQANPNGIFEEFNSDLQC